MDGEPLPGLFITDFGRMVLEADREQRTAGNERRPPRGLWANLVKPCVNLCELV